MPKISLAGWKDPVRRPRFIIWTGVAVLVMAAFVIVALGATSTYWFCANGCHKVQDDTIIAYDRSSHSRVSCMACHMPVGADPVTFLLHKATALGELYLTATNQFHLPLNPGSHLALDHHHMGSEQCTQCHNLATRNVTPSPGIIIDHNVHEEEHIHCTVCHNRVAHREDFELTLEGNKPHDDFMEMTACYRCHTLLEDSGLPLPAPGACAACHTPDFDLKPGNHKTEEFYPRGHADMALEDDAKVEAAVAYRATKSYYQDPSEDEIGFLIPMVGEVSYCATCHVKDRFCFGCHGMEMPHPEEFKTKTHPESVEALWDKCVMCHNPEETYFCEKCHHGSQIGWEYDTAIAWQTQHATASVQGGIDPCFEACHTEEYCFECHSRMQPFPASHREPDFLRRPAGEIGEHAVVAKAQPRLCAICHGSGDPNSQFCISCHRLEMPHPQQFKQFHAATGRDNPAVCANCHTFRELCSDCHHAGAIDGQPWLRVHAGVVSESGGEACLEACHEKDFCVTCHTTSNVVPASHAQAGFTRRPSIDVPALHPQAFSDQPDSCTYCHGDGGAAARFCRDCHVIEMPHPADFKDTHKAGFQNEELRRAWCETCHVQFFCDRCHHEGATGARPWQLEHPAIVKEGGAEQCFECHEPTSCSFCHVRLGSR